MNLYEIIGLEIFRGSVVSVRLSADEQILYSGSLDKDCVMWDLSSGQIRFKKSCSSRTIFSFYRFFKFVLCRSYNEYSSCKN
jgi:WD40 repeat protein